MSSGQSVSEDRCMCMGPGHVDPDVDVDGLCQDVMLRLGQVCGDQYQEECAKMDVDECARVYESDKMYNQCARVYNRCSVHACTMKRRGR